MREKNRSVWPFAFFLQEASSQQTQRQSLGRERTHTHEPATCHNDACVDPALTRAQLLCSTCTPPLVWHCAFHLEGLVWPTRYARTSKTEKNTSLLLRLPLTTSPSNGRQLVAKAKRRHSALWRREGIFLLGKQGPRVKPWQLACGGRPWYCC